jgi:outer membrane protein TolC
VKRKKNWFKRVPNQPNNYQQMKQVYLFCVLAFWFSSSWGQSSLTLDQAIAAAIEQNASIKIQRLETVAARNDVFKANAGKLPTVNAVAGGRYNNSYADVKLRTFQADPEFITLDEFGVQTAEANVGVQADYLLYDGGRSNARFRLLEELSDLERAKQEVLINQTILEVANVYFEILKLQNQAAFLTENINTSQARIENMEDKKSFGKATSLDILQLQTALNEDESTRDRILLVKANLMKDLNFLMRTSLDQNYTLADVAEIVEVPSIEATYEAMMVHNPQLRLSQVGLAVANTELTLNEVNNRPLVSSFANVGYNYQSNDVQQLARLHSAGVTVGLNASFNLFDGGVQRNRVAHAAIGVEIASEQCQLLVERLYNQVLKTHSSILLLQAQLQRAEQNLTTFEEAYAKTQDLFSAGKTNNLALRDAQIARLNALLRIDDLKVELLKADLQLKQLTGKLVEN